MEQETKTETLYYFIEDMGSRLWYVDITRHITGKLWTNDPQKALSSTDKNFIQSVLDDLNIMTSDNMNLQITEHLFSSNPVPFIVTENSINRFPETIDEIEELEKVHGTDYPEIPTELKDKIFNKIRTMSNETKQEHHSPKDWVEDFDQENGNYSCTCVFCKEEFTGYKRRVVCKECDAKEHTVEGCVTAVLDLRKQEHTERELWKVVLTPNGYSVFNSIGKKIASQVSKVEAERIIACVNAMEGIEDPGTWMKDIIERLADDDHEIFELQKYKTACESINKENPMAVAENLKEMEHFLHEVAHHDLYGEELIKYLTRRSIELLTKIQSK